jgi:molybdate transport system substrate-binding protein
LGYWLYARCRASSQLPIAGTRCPDGRMPSAERAAAVVVLSGGAMRRFLTEAVPLFERDSGIKANIRYAVTREMKAEIEAGAVFDVALLPRWAIHQLVQAGKIAAGSPTDIVRSLVGLMVRTGAPAPDISTADAFKKVLRQAKSISYSKGPSGLYVAELLERLGLAGEMKDKTVFAIGRPVGEVIASGEAEIGMQQIIENQPVKGAHLVGPLPKELGNFVPYTAGFAPGGADKAAARALVAFLASPEAVRIIRAKGMEPA